MIDSRGGADNHRASVCASGEEEPDVGEEVFRYIVCAAPKGETRIHKMAGACSDVIAVNETASLVCSPGAGVGE